MNKGSIMSYQYCQGGHSCRKYMFYLSISGREYRMYKFSSYEKISNYINNFYGQFFKCPREEGTSGITGLEAMVS